VRAADDSGTALRVLAAAAALAVFLAPPARAATIQLTILAQTFLAPGGLRVHLDVRNNGDARARNVVPIVIFRGDEVIGTLVPGLEPKHSLLQTLTIPLSKADALRGAWPLYVRVSYGDLNNHPFEAVHVVSIPFGSDAPPDAVDLQLSGARIVTTGELPAKVRGPSGTSVALTFVVPVGLAVTPDQTVVALAGKTRRVTAFVTNAGATDASALPAFAVAEYDRDGRHGTAVATATVRIASEDDPPIELRTLVIAAIAVTAIAAALTPFVRRWRNALPRT
jgi:hypothetical protein